MEGVKGGRVGVGEDDMGDGMQCSDHPYRNNPGGICAFCLQEKLGKLVSSSLPLPIRASTSSSSSPSFRSDIVASSSTITATAAPVSASSSNSRALSLSACPCPTSTSAQNNKNGSDDEYYTRRARIPFLLAKKKKKKKKPSANSSSSATSDIILKRSKSTATPRRGHSFVDAGDDEFSPRKRNGFWSFLYLSSKSSASTKKLNSKSNGSTINATPSGLTGANSKKRSDTVVEEDNSNTNTNTNTTASASSFERKVSRSRSVGCGSRSFSGDFFERISTGFGDCTLRRVESQREGKPKGGGAAINRGVDHHHHHYMKERVKCGGIFSGLMMTSSSSSSSSSSYWVSSSADDNMNGKPASATVALSHGRAKSWGWAFASPMRAFGGKTSSKRDIIRDANDKNATPNLSAIPSLLAVRG